MSKKSPKDRKNHTLSNQETTSKKEKESGGPTGLEPTRYGDWEKNGRVSDF